MWVFGYLHFNVSRNQHEEDVDHVRVRVDDHIEIGLVSVASRLTHGAGGVSHAGATTPICRLRLRMS